MRAFVTGATGFIGGRLVRQLREAGHDVRALVRDPSRVVEGDPRWSGVELARGDIRDRASVRAAMDGCDVVYHLAAWYRIGVRETAEAAAINVDGTRNVLETMAELGLRKGVYTSTIAVFSDTRGRIVDETHRYDGPMNSEYERTKHAAHYRVALPMIASGLPLVIVMPGVVYGPGDTSPMAESFAQWLAGKLPAIPRETSYCWAHVDDVARAHVLAMERGVPGASYIVCGTPHTMAEVFDVASETTRIAPPRIRLGARGLRLAARVAELVGPVVPLPSTMQAEALRSVAGTTSLASNAKARRELGWEPRPLAEGIRETMLHEMRRLGLA